jgi:tetratricopeptide (TPR) repeat protein
MNPIPASDMNQDSASKTTAGRPLAWLLPFLVVSAAYLYAFPQANIFFAVVVLLHTAAGILTSILLAPALLRIMRNGSYPERIGWSLIAAGAVFGLILIKTGTARLEWKWLYLHILISLFGVALLIFHKLASRPAPAANPIATFVRAALCITVLAALSYGARYLRESWHGRARIENPAMPPASMDAEGDGSQGMFFPSSAQVVGNQKIPSKFFMESDSCQRCHQDIYKQWFGSAHHFSSFNNQWYRKSIEYMQDTVGTRPSKWCGGCHDPAVLYSGLMDTPIKQIVHRPEAQAGLGCMMCHSIASVKSTMGQADFYLEYPKLHELAADKNPVTRALHDFVIRLNPEPHRRTFLKPFMREQTAEFCSSCHKVHLDVPVNSYRWFRGFNEYDNWQASGVSGQGARSFYYPPKPQQCADCHMPPERSDDAGNSNGVVHSHRFPAANTAVPTANQDNTQLQLTEGFLKSGALTVDIFAVSPAQAEKKTSAAAQSELSTTFAVGEEAETKITPADESTVSPVTAPLNRVQPALRRGDTVRVDVVVRTKKVGHFFPGGTVDAYDTWLELKAVDDRGQTIFWSGKVENDGKGPVEKGAHFYRSLQIDAHGNPINKRNAWATRAVVYVRLIPPGAADTVHYRMSIPQNTGNKITLRARLLYRKFAWLNTQFAFAGESDEKAGHNVAAAYDDRPILLTKSLEGVSAKEEKIPDVPIVTIAENEVTLPVVARNAPPLQSQTVARKDEWQRWNDYGIGLFLQGDLKSAAAAFQKVTEADPANPDGWVNLGRCAVQEGDMERARVVLEKALALSPRLARANYFYARVLRSDGNYDGAAARLRIVLDQYPRDRVALNDLGRVLFLQRKYDEAVKTLQSVLTIDPEDLQAHYNLMLCYSGLGNETLAKEHQARYLRFKADESSQAITGAYRQSHPEDNNERQAVHEHVSIDLRPSTTRHGETAALRQPQGQLSAVRPGKARLASIAAAPGGSR